MARPKRLPHLSYVGRTRYFLTFCARGRREAFKEPRVASETTAQFKKTAIEQRFAILAYCLMPDHAHLLVEGLDDASDLRRFAKLAKQRSGGVHRKHAGERLWQPGYFERLLRDDDSGRELAQYIIHNPVRAGLVASPMDYPYLGSASWTLNELVGVSKDGGSKRARRATRLLDE
jgi:REP element-mobilizing transposase RayT